MTVAEATQLLNTNDATLGAVIPQMQVANLPLAIRNWDDLLALVPGVQGDRYTEQGGGTSFGRTGGINVHGARALQNNFLLDGVDNNSISENVQELTTQVSRPSVDAIQEFKVVTSPYSAEYGRSPGAAVSVSTKSGTNDFHGTGYEYFRNESFDSNDFFSKRAGAAKPANDQNQFGGNLGGPIVKDKAFFFADYEGTRITRGVTRLTRVPTADERAGIFTSAVRDPVTGLPSPTTRFRRAASIRSPRRSSAWCRCRTSRARTTSSAPATCSTTPTGCWPRSTGSPNANDSVFARYIYSNRTRQIPGAFGGVRRRHRHVGVRQPDDQDQRDGRRLDARPVVGDGQRVPHLVVAIDVGRGAAAVRAGAAGRARRFPGRSPIRIVAGGLPGHHDRRLLRRLGPRPHRLAGLPAEVPAHEPVRVHRHAVVAARQPRAQGRRRHHHADAEPVHGRAGDARRAAVPQLVHRQSDGRLPARLRRRPAAVERVGRRAAARAQMFFVQDDWKVEPAAVAEPRPALRLHHARARSEQRADQLRSRPAAAAWCSPRTARSRIAAW